MDREGFFARNPRWHLYANRLLCVALCQGSALHFVDGVNGVKDFDVWSFFANHSAGRLHAERRRACGDFGASRFGRHPDDFGYEGRRVDFLLRSIAGHLDADPVAVLRSYLSGGSTGSARALSEKAVVLIEPLELRGCVVWPTAIARAKCSG